MTQFFAKRLYVTLEVKYKLCQKLFSPFYSRQYSPIAEKKLNPLRGHPLELHNKKNVKNIYHLLEKGTLCSPSQHEDPHPVHSIDQPIEGIILILLLLCFVLSLNPVLLQTLTGA